MGTSITLDKKVRPNANYLPDRRKSLFSKLKKGSKGTRGLGDRGDVLIAALSKKKEGAGRPRISQGC